MPTFILGFPMRMQTSLIAIALSAGLLASLPALAADNEFNLMIKDHRFQPEQLTVPAGKRIKLIVDNQDATPEEFESHDLRREKVIPGNSKGTVWIGPLPAGKYGFYGEFHEATAKGQIVAQ